MKNRLMLLILTEKLKNYFELYFNFIINCIDKYK